MKTVRACKTCHVLTEKDVCPNCNIPTSKRWRGYVIIRDPSHSQVAEKMNIKKPGKYALKVM
jgi:DNA-directed RNA polymerase subunit E"